MKEVNPLSPPSISNISMEAMGPEFQYKFIISKQDDKIIAILDSLDFSSFLPALTSVWHRIEQRKCTALLNTDTSEIMSDWRNRYYDAIARIRVISLECVVVKINYECESRKDSVDT